MINTHTFDNGLTLLGEQLENVASVAFSVVVPCGVVDDPEQQQGLSVLLSALMQRGAGELSTTQFSNVLDELGVQRSYSSGLEVAVYTASMLSENLYKALAVYQKMLLSPQLPEAELENVRSLALQDIRSLEDDPASKVNVELTKRFYPEPFGRSQLGTESGIANVGIEDIREHYSKHFCADGAIIAVAGDFDWHRLRETVGNLFSAWNGNRTKHTLREFGRVEQSQHIEKDTSQLQIAFALRAASLGEPGYYEAQVASSVLSGGMFGRLFVEVREKRGLVYSVSASHSGARMRGGIFAYAGTTPENGQETLDVMLAEFETLKNGISEEEMKRAKADLKSRLIMRSELSSVRASAIAADWWNIGCVRTLQEVKAGIERITEADIISYLEHYPVRPITLLTIGSRPLELRK